MKILLNWIKSKLNPDRIVEMHKANPQVKNVMFLNRVPDSQYIGYLEFCGIYYHIIDHTAHYWICRSFTQEESLIFDTMWS